MHPPHYPNGEEIHAGDRILIQDQEARVMFIKEVEGFSEFAPDVSSSDWDFIPDKTIFLEFDDGRQGGFDGFCGHDGIILVSRRKPSN